MDNYTHLQRRMFIVLVLLLLIWAGIAGRLLWIQVIATRSFSEHHIDLIERSVTQRQQEFVLDTGRGQILDNSGQSFTGDAVMTVIGFPLARHHLSDSPKINQLANILQVSSADVKAALNLLKTPGVLQFPRRGEIILTEDQAKKVEALKLQGIIAAQYHHRYDEKLLAAHLIGYVGKNPELVRTAFAKQLKEGTMTVNSLIGASGIERSLQPFLQGIGPSSISYFVDGKGYALNGLTVRYQRPDNEFYPLSAVTTLNKDVQEKAEKAMDEAGIRDGALVLLDINTSDVVAMVSRPNYDPMNVNPTGNAWVNRALKQTVSGSVFKTVIAAAALNEGLVKPNDSFVCNGEYGKYKFSCWKKGGHGHITFEQAYAESCNIVFGDLARKLGADKIEKYAKSMGVTAPVGWQADQFYDIDSFSQYDNEEPGKVFGSAQSLVRNDPGNLLRTGIGQQDVQMTPLQAANMVAGIVNEGNLHRPRVISALKYRNGTSFYAFKEQELDADFKLDRYTFYTLRKMMRQTVEKGTATSLNDTIWKVAGKTGTGELANGSDNQWFIGYAPVDKPKYAVAVVAKNVPSGRQGLALQAVELLMNALAK